MTEKSTETGGIILLSHCIIASFPGSGESLVHTDRILIIFIAMNRPLMYYLA